MNFKQFLISKHFVPAVMSVLLMSVFAGCKHHSSPGSEQSVASPTAAPEESLVSETKSFRIGLTSVQWLTKEEVTPAESKTVDSLIKSIRDFYGPVHNLNSTANWAEKNMQIVYLNNEGLTDISPLLVFKKIVTLSMPGNNFTQDQLNGLLASLPNLKTLVKDKGLKCDSIKYPNVTCIE